ncbi:AT hook, DNA-binding motif [Fusarium oxysporum f. sp. vasinfectum]|nr:AT hook, DNA-binding motif [Fusarium oxysporum f. sp. vasinfectum]
MSFNSINPGNQSKKTHHTVLPSHITRFGSVSDSLESEDPLARDAPTRSHSQSPVKQHPGSLTPSGRSSLAVVLTRSPAHLEAYRGVSIDEEDGFDAPVTSDLAPRGRPKSLFKAVNALKTSSPGGTQTGVSSDATSTTPARGRGRPKGSTNKSKGLQTAAGARQARQAATKPRPHPNGFPKRRGRPPKQPSPPPETIYYQVDAPIFPFLCEWRDCKAELHNLETLRRHVYIIHGDDFETDVGFKEHIEEAHLVPLSWHCGDGFNNNLGERSLPNTAEDVPDYLKDEHGNQVTPSIRDQQEEDLFTWRKNRRKLKELLIRMNDNLPDESNEEMGVERQAV